MSVDLQIGLYDLCRMRIAEDEEFKTAAVNRNFDHVDDALFDEYRLWQIKKTLRRVYEKSAFYKRAFDGAGVTPEDFKTLEDLGRFPFTTSKDLSGNSYSFLCTSQSEVERPVTFYTSGTTGMKKRLFFSQADVKKIIDFLPRGMNTVIDRDEASIMCFLQNSLGRGLAQLVSDSWVKFGMKSQPVDLREPVEEIYRKTVESKVNVWFGEAITINRATRIMKEQMGIDLRGLDMKCIFITMTNIPDSMVHYLEDAWGCRVSTHYGLTESGWGLAVDCDVCPGYHYDELNHYVEVVDPVTGEPLPCGETGEIVLTNIARDCMPLIRYRTGDIAKKSRAVCGSHLELLGHIQRRKEGAYILDGREYFPAMFDEALFTMPEVLDYMIFSDGERFHIDVEVIDENCFDCEKLAALLMAEPRLAGIRKPVITPKPCGAFREICFHKKRILPVEEREKAIHEEHA